MGRVSDKVVIVTGGTSGIGESTCMLLAKEGATVAVTGRNDEAGKKVVDAILKNGGKAQFWHMDTSIEAEVEAAIKSIAETFGRIDGLVNNAGIGGTGGKTHTVTEAQWDATMAINVKGVFFCTKHVIPYMLKNNSGSIANISSAVAIVSSPMLPPEYSASKASVRLMSKTDALIYAKSNIRVNSVHPGPIWTPFFRKSADSFMKEGLLKRVVLGIVFSSFFERIFRSLFASQLSIPMKRVADPMEIAYGIVFLISDESSFITGSELVMDGGLTAQ